MANLHRAKERASEKQSEPPGPAFAAAASKPRHRLSTHGSHQVHHAQPAPHHAHGAREGTELAVVDGDAEAGFVNFVPRRTDGERKLQVISTSL